MIRAAKTSLLTCPLAAGCFIAGHIAMAQVTAAPPAAPSGAAPPSLEQRVTDLSREVEDLKKLVDQLKDQLVAAGVARAPVSTPTPASAPTPASTASSTPPPPAFGEASQVPGAATSPVAAVVAYLPPGVTINALLDGYYEYNFNAPLGRINSLRAYDVSSNSFSINQADIVAESAPDLKQGKRWGVRLDLQFGQATETLQGNPANELRPDVYRDIFQAYGTYVFPVAQGLTVDFGKWASSLGIEGNYTQDQLNYSRSLWFDFLPFYHTGARAKLQLNDLLAVDLWVVNGTDQTEAFNNYKDQLYGFVLTPTSAVSWTFNFYQGQEHPDVVYLQTEPAGTSLPNQQGTYVLPISNPANGKLHIADSYVTWQVSKALTLAAEADYVTERFYSYSLLQKAYGGALYAGYQIAPRLAVATRAEYLADIGGLYSGVHQYLKEGTLTLDYRPSDGFLVRGEYRRDQSNQRYFLESSLGSLATGQPTLGVGLVWWFGQKAGPW